MASSAPSPEDLVLAVRVLPHGEGLPLPRRATPGSSGLDLRAAVVDPVHVAPGERTLVPTGICLDLPPGYEGQVRPRSGLALKHGVTVLNAPGTIDQDYHGELRVILINLGREPFSIERGARIAQLVLAPVALCTVSRTDQLPASSRGVGGFGSTGSR